MSRLTFRGAHWVILGGVFLGGPAQANDKYPPRIQRDLGLAKPPDCQICHRGTESSKSAVRPFAQVLQQLGLPAATVDLNALSAALAQDKACNVDSDGDGVSDITELTSGHNPSDGTGAPTISCGGDADGGDDIAPITLSNPPPFKTGCAMATQTASPRDWRAPLPLLALLAGFIARRRRKRFVSR